MEAPELESHLCHQVTMGPGFPLGPSFPHEPGVGGSAEWSMVPGDTQVLCSALSCVPSMGTGSAGTGVWAPLRTQPISLDLGQEDTGVDCNQSNRV